MAIWDTYQVKITTRHPDGQDMLNVHYYQQQSAGDGDASDLYQEFMDSVATAQRGLMTDNANVVNVQVINGNNNTDFQFANLLLPGTTIVSTPAASFVALGFRSPAPPPGQRYSYKRIGALPATWLDTSDGRWDTNIDTPAAAYATAVADTLEGTEAAYSPVQVTGGFSLGVAPTPVRNLNGFWQFNRFPTHQTTRQVLLWEIA